MFGSATHLLTEANTEIAIAKFRNYREQMSVTEKLAICAGPCFFAPNGYRFITRVGLQVSDLLLCRTFLKRFK